MAFLLSFIRTQLKVHRSKISKKPNTKFTNALKKKKNLKKYITKQIKKLAQTVCTILIKHIFFTHFKPMMFAIFPK